MTLGAQLAVTVDCVVLFCVVLLLNRVQGAIEREKLIVQKSGTRAGCRSGKLN